MIRFSNGHEFEYMLPSGTMNFHANGWLYDKPFIWAGLMKPELFTIVTRTLTRYPRLYPEANLSWARPWTWFPWSPWSSVRFLPNGGTANKIGLYNPGFYHWKDFIAPSMDFKKNAIVVSIHGNPNELTEMSRDLNRFPLKAIEVNVSCANDDTDQDTAGALQSVLAVRRISKHPIILKLSATHNYLDIAYRVAGSIEAISLNSAPWEAVFPGIRSPLENIGPLPGGGAVSGRPAQKLNWKAVEEIAFQGLLPVIGPGVMEYSDIAKLRSLGAKAISFGSIHLRAPWKPTEFTQRDIETQARLKAVRAMENAIVEAEREAKIPAEHPDASETNGKTVNGR